MPEQYEKNFWTEVEKFIADRSVGIVNVNTKNTRTIGTATLIEDGTRAGLLTCGHVVKEVQKQNTVALVRFNLLENQNERIELSTKDAQFFVLTNADSEIDGPDLGFIFLPPEKFALLKAKMSPVEWEAQTQKASAAPPPNTQRSSFVMGMLAVWEEATPTTIDERTIKYGHKGLINAGKTDNPFSNSDGLDFFDFDVDNGPLFDNPKSYGGTSGSAVWSFYWRKTADNKLDIIERRLLGICYYATYEKTIRIRCHGPISMHHFLRNKLRVTS